MSRGKCWMLPCHLQNHTREVHGIWIMFSIPSVLKVHETVDTDGICFFDFVWKIYSLGHLYLFMRMLYQTIYSFYLGAVHIPRGQIFNDFEPHPLPPWTNAHMNYKIFVRTVDITQNAVHVVCGQPLTTIMSFARDRDLNQ